VSPGTNRQDPAGGGEPAETKPTEQSGQDAVQD